MKLIPATKLSESVKTARYRNNWIVCVLIALLLFVIGMAMQLVVMVPVTLIQVFRDPAFGKIMSGGSFTDAFGNLSDAFNGVPSWFTLLSLFLTATVIVVCLFYTRKIDRRSLATAGFCGSKPFLEYLIGLVIGAAMLAAAMLLCVVIGTAKIEGISSGISWLIVLYFAGYLVQGMSEELLCRGVLMQKIAVRYAPIVAVLVNAVFFAALHSFNPGLSVLAFVNLILFGIFASLYMWKRGSIWGIAALHSAWNFVQGNVFGVEVSGSPLASSVLKVSVTEGGKWMNGGSFGLEGGLAVTIVYVIGIVVLLLLPVRKEARLDA